MPEEYVSLEVRLGLSTSKPVDSKRAEFHAELLKLLFPKTKRWHHIGGTHCIPLSHHDCDWNPDELVVKVCKTIQQEKVDDRAISCCIIDFSGNSWVSLREVLIDLFFKRVLEIYKTSSCRHLLILLPRCPLAGSLSYDRILHTQAELEEKKLTLVVLGSSNGYLVVSGSGFAPPEWLGVAYVKLIRDLLERPEQKLESKLIRRLGHFRTIDTETGEGSCRIYSYCFLEGCDHEFLTLFTRWWRAHQGASDLILFDLKNNNPFRTALVSLRDKRRGLKVERIDDVIDNDEFARQLAAQYHKCLLVLDVVESGKTLRSYVIRLQDRKIDVYPQVVAAVNKAAGKDSPFDGFRIKGLVGRNPEVRMAVCSQCALGLPFTSDETEPYDRIRAFDMLTMAKHCGYAPEPQEEVPYGQKRYECLPDFDKMLEEYGDWIAYKIISILRKENMAFPLIVYPGEAQSTAVVERLQKTWGEESLIAVRVDQSLVRAAKDVGNEWARVRENPDHREQCNTLVDTLLNHGKDTSSVIVDVYWGSGSNCTSLERLLDYCGCNMFAYVCIVDFDPSESDLTHLGRPRLSLYKWYNPRPKV